MSEWLSMIDVVALCTGRVTLALAAVACAYLIVAIRFDKGVYGASVFNWGAFLAKLEKDRAENIKAIGFLIFPIRGDWYLGLSLPKFVYRRIPSKAKYIKLD